MLKAILFDMDGVIIDSEPLHCKAFQKAMKLFGLDLSKEYCYQFIGNTDRYMVDVLVKDFNLPNTSEEVIRTKQEVLNQLELEESYPAVPYVVDLIKNLSKHPIKLAIASSSPMEQIERTAIDLNLTSYFHDYVSGMDLKHSKPAPDIFLKAASLLGVSPDECLVIEDSYNGVTAAKAAGMTCVGYYNENSGNQDLSGADIIVEGFEEITFSFLNNVYLRSHGEPVTIATTERLIIRELSVDDIVSMYHIYQQPEVREFVDDIDDYLQEEIEKHKAYIKNVYNFYGYGFWGIFSRETSELIGRCGIQNSEINGRFEIELGYLLNIDHWGYGYALECTKSVLEYAFYELHIPRIVAVIDKKNSRSTKVAMHVGMNLEAEIYHKGRNCDLYVIENPNIE
ncbi:GNAT family N-acetyltransferase [Lachnoclostridium phytofermentans]|uniref:HAD-superfamily hydrolase, subfamily IA, variant 3 n=1 Tax=Lachnoclostridium phytofermentans (strain ATCC 700394 / DSM 18823 / ISDg) TaxID=357809 RepID=A9KKN8_LACP7|nr:GNAT family N-acetyltransferase [Lachnoclostridium phytofermentans]ABX41209.1 HAD-superfamily hydrolase, subfamily IA, variant 3 [Lachnoclostridium phytofermentans ISDg]